VNIRSSGCVVVVDFDIRGARKVPLVTEGEIFGVKIRREGAQSRVVSRERTKRREECPGTKEQS
jgi:hypothetical protein